MTDGQILLLAFLALYLAECCYWLPLRAVAFAGGKAKSPGPPVANERAGMVWLNPLPPAGRTFPCEPWPFSVSPDGVSSAVVAAAGLAFPPPHPGCQLSWTDGAPTRIATDGKKLYAGGKLLATCASSSGAAELADFLTKVDAADRADRAALIHAGLARALSRDEAESRIAACNAESRPVRWSGALVLVWCFLILPPAYTLRGPTPDFFALLGLLPVLMLVSVVLEFRAHRRRHPTLGPDRWIHSIVAAIAPQHAARAGDLLARDALGATHPAALADAGALATIWRDAAHPVPGADDPVALAFHQEFLVPALRPLAAAAASPPDRDGSSAAYCPRCLEQFTDQAAACEACGGIALVTFGRAED